MANNQTVTTVTNTGVDTGGNAGQNLGQESSLSPWVGDYVTDYLSDAWAVSDLDYSGFTGDLSAGASDLQTDAFSGIAGLALPDDYANAGDMAAGAWASTADYMGPDNITTDTWNNEHAQHYMNPFIMQALNPQLDELRRQGNITRLNDNARLTQAGAYGGSRQAIMNSELNDNTARLMNQTVGEGYRDAYNTAGDMFTSDRDRMLRADQASADTGLRALDTQIRASGAVTDAADAGLNAERNIYGDQLDAGAVQRGITAEGLLADQEQFKEERDFPYNNINWRHSLLDGLPIGSQSNTYSQPSTLSNLSGSIAGTMDIYNQLFGPDGFWPQP